MKKLVIINVIVSLTLNVLYSQRVDTIYYNNKDQVVTSKNFDYFRIVRQDSDRIKVFDYTKSGKIKMSGAYRDFNFSEEIGPFYYYSKNGIKQLQIHQPSKYSEIYYKYKSVIDNMPLQPDSLKLIISFFANNNVKSIGYASDCCSANGPWFYFTNKGKPYSMETYQNDIRNGPYVLLFENNSPYIKGQYKNDKKDGEWTWYNIDGKITLIRIYTEGKITSVKILR